MNKIIRRIRFCFSDRPTKLKYAKLRRQRRYGRLLAELFGAEKASYIMSTLIDKIGYSEALDIVSKITRQYKNPKELYYKLLDIL